MTKSELSDYLESKGYSTNCGIVYRKYDGCIRAEVTISYESITLLVEDSEGAASVKSYIRPINAAKAIAKLQGETFFETLGETNYKQVLLANDFREGEYDTFSKVVGDIDYTITIHRSRSCVIGCRLWIYDCLTESESMAWYSFRGLCKQLKQLNLITL